MGGNTGGNTGAHMGDNTGGNTALRILNLANHPHSDSTKLLSNQIKSDHNSAHIHHPFQEEPVRCVESIDFSRIGFSQTSHVNSTRIFPIWRISFTDKRRPLRYQENLINSKTRMRISRDCKQRETSLILKDIT